MSETGNTLISFKSEVDRLRPELCLVETEDTWERITRALVSLNGLCQYVLIKAPSELVNILRPFHLPVTKAMNSERTRLSMAASDFIASIAGVLGASFEPLLPLFLPPLLSLCGRTNKVIINHARSSIISIIQVTQLPSFLQFFLQFIKDKSSSLRLVAAEGTLVCLNCCNPPDLEKDTRASAIEAIIRGTARDANPEVRKLSKQMFSAYKILLPNRVESFTAPLTPTMRKYLDIRGPPTLKQLPVIKPFSKPGHMPTKSACSSNDMRTRSHKLPVTTPATACSQAVQPSMANRQRSKEISPPQYVPVRPISRSTPSAGNIEHTNQAVAGPSLSGSVRRVIDSATVPSQVNTRPGFTANNPHTAGVNGPRRVPLPERSTQSQVQFQSVRPKEQIGISKVVAKTAPKLLVAPAVPRPLKAGKPILRDQTVTHPTLPSTTKIKTSPSRKVKQTRAVPAAKPIWGRPALRGTKPTRGKCPLNQETTTRPEQAPQPPVKAEASSLLTLASRSTTPAAFELPPSPATSQPMSSVDDAHDDVDERDALGTEHPTVEDVATFADVEESEMESAVLNASNNNNATETGLIGHSAAELPSTPSMGVSANFTLATKTPISALLSSIQQGFEFSPSSPLSPPQGYDLPGSSKVGVDALKIPFSFNTTQSTRRALAT